MIYIIKFKFAGSGNYVWRKAYPKFKNNKLVTLNENGGELLFKFSKDESRNIYEILRKDKILNILTKDHEFYKIKSYYYKLNPILLFVNQKYTVTKVSLDDSLKSCKLTPKPLELFATKEFIKKIKNKILKYWGKSKVIKNNIEILDLDKMIEKYGTNIGKGKVFIWRKESTKTENGEEICKIEYTVPGPQARLMLRKKGLRDTGEFSIKNNIKNALPVIEDEIKNCEKKCKNNNDKVYVLIKGHSRGGVAADILLNKITQEFKDNKKIEICSVLLDPVPGSKVVSDRKGFLDADKYNKISLDQDANTAVIYSINSGHKFGLFKPQKIYNSKVTIISEITDAKGQGHSVGTKQIEYDNIKHKYHKRHFKFNGKDYNPGKLYMLNKGLYWANQEFNEFNLTKIDKGNANRYISKILDKGENCRKKFLCHLIYNEVIKKEDIENIINNFKKEFNNNYNNYNNLNSKILSVFKKIKNLFYKYKKFEELNKEVKNIINKKFQNKDELIQKSKLIVKKLDQKIKKKKEKEDIICFTLEKLKIFFEEISQNKFDF